MLFYLSWANKPSKGYQVSRRLLYCFFYSRARGQQVPGLFFSIYQARVWRKKKIFLKDIEVLLQLQEVLDDALT